MRGFANSLNANSYDAIRIMFMTGIAHVKQKKPMSMIRAYASSKTALGRSDPLRQL
jgi:hypothetical protein